MCRHTECCMGDVRPRPPRLTQIGLGALKDSGLSWNEGSREVIMPERGPSRQVLALSSWRAEGKQSGKQG